MGQVLAKPTRGTFTSLDDWGVDPRTRHKIDEACRADSPGGLVIGLIDNDGRVLCPFGNLPGLDSVAEADFVPRGRFSLDVVLRDGKVLIRKDFNGQVDRFVREWHTLSFLDSKANVPAVYDADEQRCILYKNLIPGRTIRSILAEAGARILTVQTAEDPELRDLDEVSRIVAVWDRGQVFIDQCLPSDLIDRLEDEVRRVHAAGVAGLSLTFGNIIVGARGGEPWLIDFEGARSFGSRANPIFRYLSNQDRSKLNRIYGRNLKSKTSHRFALVEFAARLLVRITS